MRKHFSRQSSSSAKRRIFTLFNSLRAGDIQFAYHDHVLTGALGLGESATAGQFRAPWKIIVLMYKPEMAFSLNFQPITSADDIDDAEAVGEFLRINPGAANPFEIDTGTVLICPFVSPHA